MTDNELDVVIMSVILLNLIHHPAVKAIR